MFTRPDEAIRSEIINDVIVGDLMMNPSRFVIRVDDGVVVLEGEAERSSLIPQVKIIGRGGKLPGTYQGRRGPRRLRGAVTARGPVVLPIFIRQGGRRP